MKHDIRIFPRLRRSEEEETAGEQESEMTGDMEDFAEGDGMEEPLAEE